MTVPVFAATDDVEYRTDEAELARFAEVPEATTPAEWADEAYNTMRMLVIVAVGAAGFWCAVGVILTGKWMGWW